MGLKDQKRVLEHSELISFIHSTFEIFNKFYEANRHIDEVKNIFNLDGVYKNLVRKIGLEIEPLSVAEKDDGSNFSRTNTLFSRRNTIKSPDYTGSKFSR